MELRELLRQLEIENYSGVRDPDFVTIDDARAIQLYDQMKNAIQYVFEYFPPDEYLKMYYIMSDKKTSDDKQQQEYFNLKYRMKQLNADMYEKKTKLIRCQSVLSIRERQYEEFLETYNHKEEELRIRTDKYVADQEKLEIDVRQLCAKENEYEKNKEKYTADALQDLSALIQNVRLRLEKRGAELKEIKTNILSEAIAVGDEKCQRKDEIKALKELLYEIESDVKAFRANMESEQLKCNIEFSKYDEDFVKQIDIIMNEKETIRNKELEDRRKNIELLNEYINKCFELLIYFIVVCQTGNLTEADRMAKSLKTLYSRMGNTGIKCRANMLDAKKSKHCQKNRYEQMDEYYVEIAKKYSDCTQYQKIIKCLKDSNVDIFDMNDVDFLKICFDNDEKAIDFNRERLNKVMRPFQRMAQYYHDVINNKKSEYSNIMRSFWDQYDNYGDNEVELIKYLYNLDKQKRKTGIFDDKHKIYKGYQIHPNYREWDLLKQSEKAHLLYLLKGLCDSKKTFFKYMTSTRFEDADCAFYELLEEISGDFSYVCEDYLHYISHNASHVNEKKNKHPRLYDEYKATMKKLYELSRRITYEPMPSIDEMNACMERDVNEFLTENNIGENQ